MPARHAHGRAEQEGAPREGSALEGAEQEGEGPRVTPVEEPKPVAVS